MKEVYAYVSCISTVDTDVLVLAMTAALRLNITVLALSFGVGKRFRHLSAHEMAQALELPSPGAEGGIGWTQVEGAFT